ncbi:MAG: DMT family transporter [Treponema sp.]|jgi:drug/metabolite transporter (DMT)-like permease|nr:DMT family transporter [Treponema sp.]
MIKKTFSRSALRADILLLLTAAIWGFGFVAQRSGMEYVGPFTFNGVRFVLGSLSLLPVILIRRKRPGLKPAPFRRLLFSSLAAGFFIFFGVIIQQFGIMFTTVGNAGFITGIYVVLTPIFAIFLKRKTGIATWIGSALTFLGLYFLSAAGRSSINPGDILVFISAIFWTAHVLLIDHLMQREGSATSGRLDSVKLDPIELSAGQFAVCAALSLLGAFLVEPYVIAVVERIDPSLIAAGLFDWQPFPALIESLRTGVAPVGAPQLSAQALIPILYGGLCSVGIAYTLQVVAQRAAPPAHATIILCFEGCFAALGGVLLLSEKIGLWTLLGFVLMLSGMLASQWEVVVKPQRINKN